MRNSLAVFLTISLYALAFAAEPRIINLELDHFPVDTDEIENFLWSTHNESEERWREPFHQFTTKKWATSYVQFSNRLVTKFEGTKEEKEKLTDVFALMLTHNNGAPALLPYALYRVKTNETEVWLIHCAWEHDSSKFRNFDEGIEEATNENDDTKNREKLGHIRIWAYSSETLEKLGFVTCL